MAAIFRIGLYGSTEVRGQHGASATTKVVTHPAINLSDQA